MLTDERSALELSEELEAAIADKNFPCVGAKSAMARGMLKTLVCYSLESAWDDLQIHSGLLEWSRAYRERPGGLRSLAVVFQGPRNLTEERFEIAMWQRLQSLADKDVWRGQPYDRSVSADPENPHFSLSFGGAAFFVIGLHSNASRPARRVPRPTMVFNLHEQFEQMRKEGRYERFRETVMRRDVALAGSANPMLARFGDTSEARQYSGRMVGQNWQCPFRDPRAG